MAGGREVGDWGAGERETMEGGTCRGKPGSSLKAVLCVEPMGNRVEIEGRINIIMPCCRHRRTSFRVGLAVSKQAIVE